VKNQKNSGLFWFFAWIVVTCLLKICPKTKKKFKVMTKKNKKTRGKPKKNKHEPQTKHSLKSFVFLVFWFSRGFIKIILLKEKSFIKGRVFTTLHNFLKI